MTSPAKLFPSLATERAKAKRWAAQAFKARLQLPPKLTGSEWADQKRVLVSPSAIPGPWRTDRLPYLREIMDTICGREYQDITIVKSSQSGGTECILNGTGFFIDQEPSSILVIQPNEKPMGHAFSKERLAPMLAACPTFRGKLRDPRSRDSGNTILQKTFAGGHLAVVGANSPASLATRPVRVVMADELDRWPASAGTEGDPLSLAEKRQITFRHRKKRVKCSSPGNEGESRIEKEWKLTDQRHYFVPCPHCGEEQVLEWRDSEGQPDIRPGRGEVRLLWEKEVDPKTGDTIHHKPETAVYVCRACGGTIEEQHRQAMLAKGRWVKLNPTSRRAGFHISGLLMPWVRFSEIAAEWLAKKDDHEQRKVFFNTTLGLLYVEMGETPNPDRLESRREKWSAEVPKGVGLLTADIDIQGDRIELCVFGWGEGEECWIIRLERFYGDPSMSDVWEKAEAVLMKGWTHQSGATMHIQSCMVDTGYLQDVAFRFVGPRQLRRVFAYKGDSGARSPISRAQRANRDGIKTFTVNPNAFKDTLFFRLRRKLPGPGYLHFGSEGDTGTDTEYFAQFGAEKRVVDFVSNKPVVSYAQIRPRNEAIDHYVMGLAALRALGMVTSQQLGDLAQKVEAQGQSPAPQKPPGVGWPTQAPKPKGGFVHSWKR